MLRRKRKRARLKKHSVKRDNKMKIFPRDNLFGEFAVPPDRSITHRAIMIGALAKGKTTIINPFICQDTQSMISCVKKLGAKVSVKKEYIEIKSAKKNVKIPKIDCGNSATAMRFVCGAIAGLGGETVLTGSKYLCQKSMREIKEPLEKMGATVALTDYVSAPILVESEGVRSIDYEIEDGNSQVKSSIIFCALAGGVRAVIHEKTPSRNHTEILLREMGADIGVGNDGKTIDFTASELNGCKIFVSRDFTFATHYLALGLLLGKVVCHNVNVNPTRIALLDVLKRMGADIRVHEKGVISGEKVADITAYKSKLRATHVLKEEAARIIDELPLLAFLMGLAEGESVISVGKLDDEKNACYSGGVCVKNYLDAIGGAVRSVGGKCRRFVGGLIIGGVDKYVGGTVRSGGYSFVTSAGAIALIASADGGEVEEDAIEADANKAFFEELNKNTFAVVRKRGDLTDVEQYYADALNMTGLFSMSVTAIYPPEDNYKKLMSELKNYSGYCVFPPYIGELSRRLYTLRGFAKLTHSANVVSQNSGYFTDGFAFVAAMNRIGETVSGKRILVLGCGGLGKGIATALVAKGAKVNIFDVDEKQAGEYVKRAKLNAFVLNKIADTTRYDYVVNTVYRRTKIKDGDRDSAAFGNSIAAVDATVLGTFSPFIQAAKEHGVRVIVSAEEFAFMRAYYAACAYSDKEAHEAKAFSMFDIYKAEMSHDGTR